MPHFSDCCGKDEYICQKCGAILCGQCHPSSWMKNVTKNEHAGNICPSCLEKHTDWKIVARPPKNKKAAPIGSFIGLMYEINVDNINKLTVRNACPCCSKLFYKKNEVVSNNKSWLYSCPSCSTFIQVVR